MSELCWLNGQVIPLSDARVSVEDRGFLFADGVYEALRIYNGKPFGLKEHLNRLERSCGGIELGLPIQQPALADAILDLIAKSGVRDGLVYLQLTRGPSPRNHVYPKDPKPTLFFYVRAMSTLAAVGQSTPYTLLSVLDERWQKCWIKSTALLANTLARNAAARAGADEAVFIDNGNVTEGASSNVFMIKGGTLFTHPLGPKILPGVTRDILLECARRLGAAVQERPLKLADALGADEVFVSSSTREIMWVAKWDDATIGSGTCGPVTMRLHEEYRRRVNSTTA